MICRSIAIASLVFLSADAAFAQQTPDNVVELRP